MSNTKKSPNTPKERVRLSQHRYGGRATASGVNYEVRIAALIATKMLAGDRSSIWDGISGADAVAITMQTPEPVDDVVVSLRGDPDANVFISAKERVDTIPLTAKSPAFADTVNAFVRQFLKLSLAARAKSRLVWAVPSSAGRAATHDLATVLDAHREDAGHAALSKFLSERQVKQRKAFEALLTETRKGWKRETAKAPVDAELRGFLRRVHVEVYEFECGQRLEREAEDTIRTHIVADPKQAKRVWGKLEHFFARADQRGVRVTAASLRGVLAADGLTLKSPPDYADDIAQLNEITKRNLARLKEHTTLRFGSKPTDAVHIQRNDELSALLAAAKSGHHLITGEPGCGKSGLIHPLAEALQKDGAPVVLLLADEVFGRGWKGSANLPELKHTLDNVLANWPDGGRGFLITDALDALRDAEMQKLLRRLLHDVKEGQSGWTVVASVREFDLKHSRELREAFPGAGVSDHCSNEFSGVAHFHLTGLSDIKLDELIALRPDIRPFIESARKNPKSGGFHRSPFFLRLAAELLRDGVTPARLADWNSPAVLLRKFWEARIEDGAGASEREVALNTICRQMLGARSMALSIKELSLGAAERTAIHELRSRGILQAPLLKHGTRVREEDIRFSHHLLHDYAIARSVIPTIPERFADVAIREPLLPVFYRQSFLFALEELWDAAGPDGFWLCALKLEGVTQLHGIARILAPILAARRVESLADLEPLLNAVSTVTDADSLAQKALRHLASGLQDADPDSIRTGAGAWCAFVERLASLLPLHPTVEGPLVQILARLNEVSGASDIGERLALNVAGRVLLAHHVAKDVSKGWRYAANTAIDAVCRTFGVAPGESERSLLSLMTPLRLAQFPHDDLFDLAEKIKHLGTEGETVVRQLFEAAFSAEPKPGDWEDFGGAILPLRTQTSDNWNLIHYVLAEYYEAQSGQNAELMTDIACIAWNAVVRRREDGRESGRSVMATVQFRGFSCDLIDDYGHIWGRDFEPEENRILSRFEKLLCEWAATGDIQRLSEALDQFVRRNRTSLMWMVIMEVGAEHPTTLGVLLEETLSESLFLTHPDYSYGGTALLGALHKIGDSACRERLERLILDLPKNARFLREEPRYPIPSWLERARDRVLGTLEESNIVTQAVRELWKARREVGPLPTNRKPEGPRVTSHRLSDEELIELQGVSLKERGNADLFRLREALKPFIERDGKRVDVAEVERHWRVIGQCERALRSHQRSDSKMAEELWGHLVGVCGSIVRNANWPPTSKRWKTVRRILLKAVNDPLPQASNEDDSKDHGLVSWGWPSPRLDAAMGLPRLVYRLGKADRPIAAALRTLCRDSSRALRINLADRLAVLEEPVPELMWQLIDIFIAHEKKFSVLQALLDSLDRLWPTSPDGVRERLRLISLHVTQRAPADHGIHATLASTYLFRFLRTGDAECEAHIEKLVTDCDNDCASHALKKQIHACRSGGWLTAGYGSTVDVVADAVRARTWDFISKLLSAVQARLHKYREQWRQLHNNSQPDTGAVKDIQAAIDRTSRLADDIATELYFASGAFAEKQNKAETPLSDALLNQFWKEAAPLLDALSSEPHPHTANHVVQTLHHLLPCAPREAFIIASKCICSSASAGFQYESLAISNVVKLIERALADHRDIFQSAGGKESDCLESLLKVLDLFVEAGWPEARKLTHRLEEIYR